MVRIGQQAGEGPGDGGSAESEPRDGDRGPAPYARIRVAHQEGQRLLAGLRNAEPAETQSGGRAHGRVGVVGRSGEHAGVLGPADPPQSLQRRGTPLRIRLRRLPQEKGDLMVLSHEHPAQTDRRGMRRLPAPP
ncbi:hypothetical protein A4E84_01575 [Streptomyces qaidamensis]|uniref:Uncharacterized protein n=1 Tax=Streptomyces qaidamensis TaxID=1783515 RepID=A0A143BSZ2_9ACTN|nr:hypothetical protein A4E84_01575 [Streptomyces qaidamensis]